VEIDTAEVRAPLMRRAQKNYLSIWQMNFHAALSLCRIHSVLQAELFLHFNNNNNNN